MGIDTSTEGRQPVGAGIAKWCRLHHLFLAIFLAFGVAFIVCIPPGQNADEGNHIARAYQVSQGQVFVHRVDEDEVASLTDKAAEQYGGQIPRAFVDTLLSDGAYQLHGQSQTLPDRTAAAEAHRAQTWSIHLNDETITSGFSNTGVYSPLVYIPASVAIWVGSALDLPVMWIFTLERIANLLVAAALLAMAIRITPVGKWAFFVMALLPTTVVQSAAVSADPVTIGLSFAAVAHALRLMFAHRVLRTRDIVLLLVLMMGVGLAKPSYAIVLGVGLLIPVVNRCVRSPKWIGLIVGALVLAGIPAVLWQLAVSYVPPSFDTVEKVHQQLSGVFHDFPGFLEIFVKTWTVDHEATKYMIPGFFGIFVWNGVAIPEIFALGLCSALTLSVFLTARSESSIWDVPKRDRAIYRGWMIVVVLVSVFAVTLGLYAVWSPLNYDVVTGVQGRYIIPFFPIFLAALVGGPLPRQRVAKWWIVAAVVLALCSGIHVSYVLQH